MTLKRTLVAAAVAILASGAVADDSHHAGSVDKPSAQHPGPQGAHGTAHMGTMQDGMKRMQEQMREIVAASDPGERQRLMSEHMKSMREAMSMMGNMTRGSKAPAEGERAGSMAHCMEMMGQMMQHRSTERPARN